MAFEELHARALYGFQIRVAGCFAVIQPGQEFQLREQMIGRCPAIDLQAKVLVVELVFEHHVAGRAIQQPGAFEQRTSRLWQARFKQVDIERAQFRQRSRYGFAELGKALQMALVGIPEREAEDCPGVYCARYHIVKYFLPSRSCWEPFQMATANGVPAFRSGTCRVTDHLPLAY